MRVSVYNPFSTLLLFDNLDFSNYWFATGSPSFLIKLIKKSNNLQLESLDNKKLSESGFDSFEIDNLNLIAILYQAGYLTIKNYDKNTMFYTLGYTNYEIEKSFKESLLQGYCTKPDVGNNILVELIEGFINQDINVVIERLKDIFLNLDYDIIISREKHFQSIVYLIFQLLGFYVKVEYKTNMGRIDAIVFIENNIYIFEFKINESAKNAIDQIYEKNYYKRFVGKDKKIYLLGINYNTKEKVIDDYLIEELKEE
jgi:hypothetical protein